MTGLAKAIANVTALLDDDFAIVEAAGYNLAAPVPELAKAAADAIRSGRLPVRSREGDPPRQSDEQLFEWSRQQYLARTDLTPEQRQRAETVRFEDRWKPSHLDASFAERFAS